MTVSLAKEKYAIYEYPSISIITPTLNSSKYLRSYFEAIFAQNYPKDKLEVLIIDGGSKDQTLDIAKEFNARIITRMDLRNNPESRKAVGIREAKGEYILLIDSDNIITHDNWIRKMLIPLLRGDAIASQPIRFHYSKNMSTLNRYFALIGNGDPVVYYMNKSDHLSYFDSIDYLSEHAIKKDFYYLIRFTVEDLPTIGANGYMIKKDIINKSNCDENSYFHIDINVDLIRQGFDTFAMIEDDIIHLTFSSNSIFKFLKKRYVYMDTYHGIAKRRYFIFDRTKGSDRRRLLKFIMFALTFVKPFIDSCRGYVRIRDIAWFIHPIMCFGFLVTYSARELKHSFNR